MLVKFTNGISVVSFKPKEFISIWRALLTFGIHRTCALSSKKGFGQFSQTYFDPFQGILQEYSFIQHLPFRGLSLLLGQAPMTGRIRVIFEMSLPRNWVAGWPGHPPPPPSPIYQPLLPAPFTGNKADIPSQASRKNSQSLENY